MGRFFICWVLLWFCFGGEIFASELPYKGIYVPAEKVARGDFRIRLDRPFSEGQISELESSIINCQTVVKNKLVQYERAFNDLNTKKARLQGFSNIHDMLKRIQTLEAEKKRIKKTLSKNLSGITFKGLYGVIVDAKFGVNKTTLTNIAISALTPRAIEDLRGIAIDSITKVKNNQVIFDKIVATTSGEMGIEKCSEDTVTFFNGRTQILYLALVNVYPLRGEIQKSSGIKSDVQVSIGNLLSQDGLSKFVKSLQHYTNQEYASQKRKEIEKFISYWSQCVSNNNDISLEQEQGFLDDMARQVAAKEEEIKKVKAELSEKRKIIKRIYRELSYSCSGNPENCLQNAIKKIEQKIELISQNALKEKEKEFISSSAPVVVEGDPAQEIVEVVKKKYKNLIASYGKREQLFSQTTVNMGVAQSSSTKQGYYITRQPKDVYLYPYSTRMGELKVLVVMRFKVNRDENGDKRKKKSSGARPKVWKDPYLGMEFVWVEGGCYEMGDTFGDGDSNEKPVHTVCVDGFWMGKYEVTVGQYLRCVDDGACPPPEWLEKGSKYNIHTGSSNYYKKMGYSLTGKNYPIVGVSWNNAKAFAAWLSRKTGRPFRLPTEAEWEYAARSRGRKVKYATSTGNLSHDLANYSGTGGRDRWKYTSPAGSFPPNPLGLYDMSGNVWEWCEDIYSGKAYKYHSRNNPIYTGSGSNRVIRGGSWNYIPRSVRCANRYDYTPGYRDFNLGFRLASE